MRDNQNQSRAPMQKCGEKLSSSRAKPSIEKAGAEAEARASTTSRRYSSVRQRRALPALDAWAGERRGMRRRGTRSMAAAEPPPPLWPRQRMAIVWENTSKALSKSPSDLAKSPIDLLFSSIALHCSSYKKPSSAASRTSGEEPEK